LSDRSEARDAVAPIISLHRTAGRWARQKGLDRLVPVGVCALLVLAAVVSAAPAASPASAAPRPTATAKTVVVAPVEQYGPGDGPVAANYNDVYLGDASVPNTLQNPNSGTDARTLLQQYKVKAGDTLRGIAAKFGLATSTVYWANRKQIPNTSMLQIGQRLWILPMDGLVIQMTSKITLASLAAKYNVTVQDIVDTNNLPDTNPAPGVLVIVPGANVGPVPKGSNGLGPKRNPRVGSWVWPVNGDNYVSQYFWSGHRAVDIAARMGTPVVAATAGTVVYAGWSSGGGGNVIWVREGTRLYTTYNHLARVLVHVGQRIYAGRRIGLVGMTGHATGPHLHFEVWLGYPWALNTDSDAVNPCRYLAEC